MNRAASRGLTTCRWVLACEISRGLLESSAFVGPELLLSELSALAPSEEARCWAALRFLGMLPDYTVQRAFGLHELPDAAWARRMLRSCTLIAELLLENRYAHDRPVRFLRARLPGRQIDRATLERFWRATHASGALAVLDGLDEALLSLTDLDFVRMTVAQTLLRRTFTWPLFCLEGASLGLSFPVGVYITNDGRAQTERQMLTGRTRLRDARFVIPSLPRILLDDSLSLAAAAARVAWSAEYGSGQSAEGATVDDAHGRWSTVFDFSATESTLGVLASMTPSTRFSPILEQFTELLGDHPQRSLESYLAQAVLARVLGRHFGARATATGSLKPSENYTDPWSLNWDTDDPDDLEAILEGMLSKARYAGRTKSYERFVVPGLPPPVFQDLQERRRTERAEGVLMPNIIGVSSLPRLADICMTGPWRASRFVRCDHLAALSEGGAASVRAQNSLRPSRPRLDASTRSNTERRPSADNPNAVLARALHTNSKRGLYIHAPGPGVETAARLTAEILASAGAAKDANARVRQRLGTLVFYAVRNEFGLPLLASLYHALAGRLDGEELAVAAAARDVPGVARTVAAWLDHRYSDREPWLGPDITVIYGVEEFREYGERDVVAGADPVARMWDVLVALPPFLRTTDTRAHKASLGNTRLIIIDGSPRVPSLPRDHWEVLRLPSAEAEPPNSTRRSAPDAYLALGALRASAPAATILSLLKVLHGDGVIRDSSVQDSYERILDGAESRSLVRYSGRFSLLPADAAVMQQRFRALTPMQQLRCHLAVVSSYAPWLPAGRIIPDLGSVATPPDEWLLPERLTEVGYHLLKGRELGRKDKSLSAFIGKIDRRRVEAMLVRHLTEVDRVNTLIRYGYSWKERTRVWNEFLDDIGPRGGLAMLPFSALFDGLSIWVDVLCFNKGRRNRVGAMEQCGAILDAMERLDATTLEREGTSSRTWRWLHGMTKVSAAWVDCVTASSRAQEAIDEARHAVNLARQQGVIFSTAGDAFEALGDFLWCADQSAGAVFWYGLGEQTRSERCQDKRSIVIGKRELTANVRSMPSRVPHLRETISGLLGIQSRGTARREEAADLPEEEAIENRPPEVETDVDE